MTDATEGRRVYAIGDIHGRVDLLEAVLAQVRADLAARPHPEPLMVFLGDYVDRGPDSRRVIETLIGLESADLPTTFLLGNHDSYIPAYLEDADWFDRTYHWLHPNMGGAETLASYGVPDATVRNPGATRDDFAAAFPPAHLAFLRRCLLWRRIGGYVFVHAGIRPYVAMENQSADDLIWIRQGFLDSDADFGFKVVHGHTIVPRVEHHPNRIAIDTGAFRTGVLTCLVLEGGDAALLSPRGVLLPLPPGAGLQKQGATVMSGLRGLWKR